MKQENRNCVELSVSDHSQLGSLQQFLNLTLGFSVVRVPGEPGAGEQGTLDVLAILAGGGSSLVAVVKVLPEFLRSRRTDLSIMMTVRGKPFTLTATNAEEVIPLLERLLDA
jgi:Effector Associated Constant Component 1